MISTIDRIFEGWALNNWASYRDTSLPFPYDDISLAGKTKILTVSLIFNTTNEANSPETLGKRHSSKVIIK